MRLHPTLWLVCASGCLALDPTGRVFLEADSGKPNPLECACGEAPAPSCDGTERVALRHAGCLADGGCARDVVRTTCPDGCADGRCVGAPCLGVRCESPPPGVCLDGGLRTFSSAGRCLADGGGCDYVSTEVPCPFGCANGRCTEQTCANVTCTTPPAPSCKSPTVKVTPGGAGTCRAGGCVYLATEETCAGRCVNGACEACAPGSYGCVNGCCPAAQVTAGGYHGCLLTSAGGVRCWGSNEFGQLGDGTRVDHLTPKPVLGLASGVKSVVAGSFHACALLQSGQVQCWGRNTFGRLGDGTFTDRATPAPVVELDDVVALEVSTNLGTTCARKNDGTLRCWGDNTRGQLGDGTFTERPKPIQPVGLGAVQQFALGAVTACAVKANGETWCWGDDAAGSLGRALDGGSAFPAVASRVTVPMKQVAVALSTVCGLDVSGAVWCWGSAGAVGNEASLSPQKTPLSPTGLESGGRWLSGGGAGFCAARSGGSGVCWGSARGFGHDAGFAEAPLEWAYGAGVEQVSIGFAHACALAQGTVKCAGLNDKGQLGSGTTTATRAVVTVVEP